MNHGEFIIDLHWTRCADCASGKSLSLCGHDECRSVSVIIINIF